MGTYTTLYLGDFELVSSKSAVIPEVMTVFVESDRRSLWRRADNDAVVEGPLKDDDTLREIEYAVEIAAAIQRLDIMGFTLERCRREYEQIRAEELRGYREADEEEGGSSDVSDSFYDAEIAKYERLTFDNYVAAFKDVLHRRIHWYDLEPDQRAALDATASYILADQHDEWHFFGFLCQDIRMFLRMALSLVRPEMYLRQDVSQLVSAGWVREENPIRDDAVRLLIDRYPENAPRIVLTEGSSDAEILRKSLSVLFPHLVGYYTFFDFHGSRAAGGASQLIAVVKAFAAAGVANRVIAVLDNDTAAHDARRALQGVRLPDNLAVVHYPARDWLREYPTLGPSGNIPLDINGKAASIELYLGRDALMTDGHLCLIQWAGYSQTMRAYQGELLDKSSVTERWRVKVDKCLADRSSIVPADWDDLRAVWVQIMCAFPA
ncbi:HEPN/Toprim-associated domain-containing protein [Caballeronia sp. LjRoot34]|uniref:HEPN/Toprim-associated domain-containing protein n=1 Tax=Caballeronia sp. LjRoot34 TaxID=3342325 RepID=UPI003ECC7985